MYIYIFFNIIIYYICWDIPIFFRLQKNDHQAEAITKCWTGGILPVSSGD